MAKQIPNYFARPVVTPTIPTPQEQQRNQQGIFGNMVDKFQGDGLSALGGMFDMVGAEGIAKQFYGWSDDQYQQMSDAGREAMGRQFFEEDEDGNIKIGEGLTSLDTWLLTLAGVAGQFAATAIPGAGAAGAVARAASLGSKGRAAANVVGMGATGGAAATGQGMEQAREEVRNMPDELLADSAIFRDLYLGVDASKPDWNEEQKWDAAKEALAAQVAREVQTDPVALAANFGASAIGDPIIGRALTGARLAKNGAFRSAVRGALIEGSTEAVQAGTQQYSINQALQPIDGRDDMDGVRLAAINEGLAGAGFGGVAGGFGGVANRQPNQPGAASPQADQTAPNSPAAPVDPAVAAVAEQNPTLGAELNALDQASANRQRDVEQALNRQRDLDMPTAARNAGFANSPQDVGRFGDMLTSPVQRSIADLDEMRDRTVADMVAMATQNTGPTAQDRFSPIQYQFEGEVIPAERRQPAGLLEGLMVEGEQAQFLPDNRIEGEYFQGIQTEPQQPKLPQKDIIFAGDNRPAQQAQERSQELERMANRFADNARNQPARIPQKDIIFAGNETGVTVKQNGQPFQSPKEALASKSAREAKKAGNQIEAVPFADGYGWQVVAPNISEQAPNISQATDTNVGTNLSDQAAVTPSPETDTAPQAAQEAQAMPAPEPVAEVEAAPAQENAEPLNNAEPAADLAGEAVDTEWTAFADDTGTKKIPRAEMPQIKAEHRGAMVQFMKGRDITHEQDTIPAADLKPTQAEFSPAKVKKAMEFDGGNRSILVSSDGYVLDGHHQWLAAREKGEAVDVIRLDAPIDTLIPLAREFPSSTLAEGATDAAPSEVSQQAEPTNQTPEQSGVSVSEDAESENAEPSAPIEDFGEKIGGARKDVWGGFADAINSDASTAELPLSKSFPEPDYVKMAADGVPMETLALIAAMRAEIPTKPRDAYKVRRWAEKVDVLRSFAADIISGDVTLENVLATMRRSGGEMAAIAEAIPAIAKANPETLKLAAKYRLDSGAFTMFKGQEYRPAKVFYFPKNGRTEMLDLSSDNKQTALDNLSALIEAESDANQDTPGTKQSKIDIYQNRYTKQVYLGWKGASGVLKIQDFPSVSAARDYLKDNRAEIEAKLERIKETPGMRRAENRDRVGPPRFAGNVTPAIFADTFGFRGVEFGNWVEQGRRQKDLNEAYDGLMDLAEVLGIPPKAIALNGELGMAFGARGKGGKRNAKAHYELNYVVINLTKEKGAGSLAHEWWHAVDHYFARMVGKKNAFATDGTSVRGEAMRKEVRAAFDDVMSAIRKSGLIQRSAKLDQRRSKPYWSTTEEASARSFEAFIIAELEAKGFSNDYLANIIEPEAWNALEEMQGNLPDQTYPYPTKAEQASINPAYRNLFDTLQTKETEKGTMLFSKQTTSSAFRNWFGDSKAVDDQGNPLVLYHGTAADFSEFSKKKATDKEGRKLGFGWGKDKFYFADSGQAASSAAEFAQMTGRGNQPNVMPVFIKTDNPMAASEYKAKVDAEIASGKTRDQAIEAVDRAIKKQGYDGIYDADTGAYAVFEPEQVKSAIGNYGSFDPNNPDIRFAAANTTGTKPAKGVPVSVAQREADRFVSSLSGAAGLKVVVLPTQKDAEKLWRMSLDGDFVRGAYSDATGTAYVIAENVRNMMDLKQTIAHEIFAHGGLDKVIGADKKQQFLDRLKQSRNNKAFAKQWAQIDRDYDGMSEDVKAEELFAYFVQNEPTQGPVKFWWNALKRWLNNVLAGLGITKKGDPDVDLMRGMMESIMFGFQFGRQAEANAENELVFSRTRGEPDTRTAREKIGQAQVASQTISDRIKATVDTIKDSSWWKAVGTRATEGIFDGLHGIKKAEEAAGITDPNKMGYVSARLATGLGDMLHALFSQGALEWKGGVTSIKKGTKGLLEVFGMLPEGDGLNNWLAWMAANRAEKLMAEGRENNLTEADIAELKALANGNEALFEEVRKEYNKINSATLDLAEQAGLISAEQRTGFDEEWYVPFFREMDIADPDLNDVVKAIKAPFTTKTGIVGQSANIKALIGGTQSTQDLLQNIIQRQVSMIDAAVKNNAAREVAGNLDGTGFMTREDSPEFDAAVEALGLTRNELATKHQKVRIMENGKPVYYYVHDAALLRGLMQVHDVGSKALFNKMARSAKRFLTTGVTLSPDFIIRNFIRDAAHAWMVNKDGAKLGTDTWKGLKASWQGDENYWKLIASGAAFQGGYIHGADPEAAQQQIRRALRANGMTTKQVDKHMSTLITSKDKLLQAFEKYRQASDKLENSNRMTVYERAIAAGKSERQALFESKDLMDYSLKGNFGLMGTLIDMLPFFNARLQGMYKLGRAAAADGDDQIFKVLSRDLAMKGLKVAAFSTALAAMYGDDERYKQLAEWDKDAHWHFFLGEGTDGHIRIPKPFELGIIFGTFPERLFNFAAGNQSARDARESVGHAVFNTLALNPVPQLVVPVYEVLRNKSSFTGAPIETLADQQREKSDRYDERTSDVTRALGGASALAGLSPKQVEHLITGYSGTLGAYTLGMADFMARVMTGREKASTPAADWPIVRTLYQGGKEQRNTLYQQRFIESLEKAREAYGSYKLAVDEQDPERAQRQFEKRAKELNARLPLERVQRRVSDINKAMRTVERDTRLTGSEKKDRLQQLQRQKNELYEQAYMRLELRNW